MTPPKYHPYFPVKINPFSLGMTPSRDTEKHNFFPGDNNSSIKESQA
jgi:hypothetical protein